ncbi:Uncharacterised protein [Mycobacteroides abscessus subsp. abscessus]|nr:Uncharacterised protein [Mycobacteroides abscessus subsp. abscessus]
MMLAMMTCRMKALLVVLNLLVKVLEGVLVVIVTKGFA